MKNRTEQSMASQSRCALCSIATYSTESAAPLVKGTVCGDCVSHVERFRLRHAIASIEVVRDGKSCLVRQEELTDADFDSMVWTTISG